MSNPLNQKPSTTAVVLQSYSADKTFVSGDAKKIHILNPAAASLSVTLPAATSLSTGLRTFQFENATEYETWLKDNSGRVLAALQTRGAVDLHLTDKSTVAGTWLASNQQGLSQTKLNSLSNTVFESAAVTYVSVAALSATQAIVCYIDSGNSSYATACVLNISGSTITIGTPVVYSTSSTSYQSVAALSSTAAIVCYSDATTSAISARVLSVSGDVITAGTRVSADVVPGTYVSVTALSATKAVVAHCRDSDNYGVVIAMSITGTTITAGTPVVYRSSASTRQVIVARSAITALLAHRCNGSSSYAEVFLIAVSGTVVSASAATVVNAVAISSVALSKLDSSRFVLCYSDSSNSNYGTAKVILIASDLSITTGEEYAFISASVASYMYASPLSSDLVFVGYTDDTASSYGKACVLSISGTTISVGSSYTFNSNATDYTAAVAITSKNAVVCYRDAGNSNFGTSVVVSRPVFN